MRKVFMSSPNSGVSRHKKKKIPVVAENRRMSRRDCGKSRDAGCRQKQPYVREEREAHERRGVSVSARPDTRERYHARYTLSGASRGRESARTRSPLSTPPSASRVASAPSAPFYILSASSRASLRSSSFSSAPPFPFPREALHASSAPLFPFPREALHASSAPPLPFRHEALHAKYGNPAEFRRWVLTQLADKPGIAHSVINRVYLESRYSAPVEAEIQDVLNKHAEYRRRLQTREEKQ